jgi:hypothetical protein
MTTDGPAVDSVRRDEEFSIRRDARDYFRPPGAAILRSGARSNDPRLHLAPVRRAATMGWAEIWLLLHCVGMSASQVQRARFRFRARCSSVRQAGSPCRSRGEGERSFLSSARKFNDHRDRPGEYRSGNRSDAYFSCLPRRLAKRDERTVRVFDTLAEERGAPLCLSRRNARETRTPSGDNCKAANHAWARVRPRSASRPKLPRAMCAQACACAREKECSEIDRSSLMTANQSFHLA